MQNSYRWRGFCQDSDFYILMFASPFSSHPEVVKTTIHPSTGPQLPHTGATAHWMAGKRTLWVFCGCVSKKETQQKLLHPRSHLPIPQGKSMSGSGITNHKYYTDASQHTVFQSLGQGHIILIGFLLSTAASDFKSSPCSMIVHSGVCIGRRKNIYHFMFCHRWNVAILQ